MRKYSNILHVIGMNYGDFCTFSADEGACYSLA